jgi:hypothetical protein
MLPEEWPGGRILLPRSMLGSVCLNPAPAGPAGSSEIKLHRLLAFM